VLDRLNAYYPVRYTVWGLCLLAWAGTLVWLVLQGGWTGAPMALWLALGLLCLLGWRDRTQLHSAVRRNYPVIGNLRFMLEKIRPEIRQYFLESDTEATPFSRSQRTLAYARAKNDTDKRPFGTQVDVKAGGYEWINHSMAPTRIATHDFRVTIGGPDCRQPYEASVFNISAMSFGALSANAVQALNQGAALGRFAHDTGEGSVSQWHRVHGGDLIWEIGSGYFGCRTDEGNFCPERFQVNALDPQVKMIEVKLSQGAKPGHGGLLPGAKVTPEIAAGPRRAGGRPTASPQPRAFSAFSTPVEFLEFLAQLRALSGGKPVGFKLCIGPPAGVVMCHRQGDAGDGPDAGLHRDRRQPRAGPVRRAAGVLQPRRHADARRVAASCTTPCVGAGLRDRVRLGACGKAGHRAFDLAHAFATGCGLVQLRPRLHVRASAASRRRPATPTAARPA
jgi:hypothetical protein